MSSSLGVNTFEEISIAMAASIECRKKLGSCKESGIAALANLFEGHGMGEAPYHRPSVADVWDVAAAVVAAVVVCVQIVIHVHAITVVRPATLSSFADFILLKKDLIASTSHMESNHIVAIHDGVFPQALMDSIKMWEMAVLWPTSLVFFPSQDVPPPPPFEPNHYQPHAHMTVLKFRSNVARLGGEKCDEHILIQVHHTISSIAVPCLIHSKQFQLSLFESHMVFLELLGKALFESGSARWSR